MKKYLIIISIVLSFFSSCVKPCTLDRASLKNSAIVVYAYNTNTKEYFYPEDEWRSPFKRDSLQVFDENGKKIELIGFGLQQDSINPLQRFYLIDIRPIFRIPEDNDAFQTEKTRKIFLKYNNTTSDTLDLIFKGKQLKCEGSVFEYLKIYHRNHLVANISSSIGTAFKLNH
jgi:hypothetical protein